VLIPFSEAAVLEIDLEGGRLLVDPIAAGLKDDGEEKPYGNAGGKPRPNNGR
jgi:16S rRNA processing protein RimM